MGALCKGRNLEEQRKKSGMNRPATERGATAEHSSKWDAQYNDHIPTTGQ